MKAPWLRPLLLLAGAASVLWLVWDLGAANVWEAFHTLGWRLAVLVLVPFALAVVFDSLGWLLLLTSPGAPFSILVGARLAGEAVNLATPMASVGGEPLKAYLVREHVPLDEGLASVIVDKTTVVIGQAVFLAAGLLVALVRDPPRALLYAMTGLLVAEIAGVSGFAWAQVAGVVGGGGTWMLDRLGLGGVERHREMLTRIDHWLRRQYRDRRAAIAGSAVLHALAWAVGGLEIYVMLRLLGQPVTLGTALALEAFGTAVKFATFMIPGSLGALEGGNAAIFAAFGLGGALGLVATLVRRLREATWVLIGMAALSALKTHPAARAASAEPPSEPGRRGRLW
jgi:glycosyltransferase 2 family protein